MRRKKMADPYHDMTHDDEVRILTDLLREMSPAAILATPGAWEVFSEELNNPVLERWLDEKNRAEA